VLRGRDSGRQFCKWPPQRARPWPCSRCFPYAVGSCLVLGTHTTGSVCDSVGVNTQGLAQDLRLPVGPPTVCSTPG
jgi:hypothetical protein